jgi:hypothetical protein
MCVGTRQPVPYWCRRVGERAQFGAVCAAHAAHAMQLSGTTALRWRLKTPLLSIDAGHGRSDVPVNCRAVRISLPAYSECRERAANTPSPKTAVIRVAQNAFVPLNALSI